MQKLPDTLDSDLYQDFDDVMSRPSLKALETEFSLEGVKQLFSVDHTEQTTVGYLCDCSRTKVKDYLKTTSRDDLEEMMSRNQPVNCMMCNESYLFSPEELMEIIKLK